MCDSPPEGSSCVHISAPDREKLSKIPLHASIPNAKLTKHSRKTLVYGRKLAKTGQPQLFARLRRIARALDVVLERSGDLAA
jgi:hypothetical protein